MAVAATIAKSAATVMFGSAVLATAVSGCGDADAPPDPVTVTTSTQATENPQQRDRRIRDQLIDLGCDTNACIQTYFGCRDGYISGEPCTFYREHPLG